MKGMSFKLLLVQLIALLVVSLIGCNDGGNVLPIPGEIDVATFTDTRATLEYTNIDVVVDVPADAVLPGEIVPMAAQVNPPNLPDRAYINTIHEEVGSIMLRNEGDPDIMLQEEMRVVFPMNNQHSAGSVFSVFRFDQSAGQWACTGKNATITDDGRHAIFTANDFGNWGVFKAIPLTVEAHAWRTVARAPGSIAFDALIDGGSPPYTVVWWFGDDSDPEGGVAVSHLYELPIKYTASVIVIDSKMREVSDEIDINMF